MAAIGVLIAGLGENISVCIDKITTIQAQF
jgi:hypothetical protein